MIQHFRDTVYSVIGQVGRAMCVRQAEPEKGDRYSIFNLVRCVYKRPPGVPGGATRSVSPSARKFIRLNAGT